MANLTELAEWSDGIYQIEKTDPVVGGENGISNRQAQQLANRTSYIRNCLIGIPLPYPLAEVPAGYLAFNGQSFSKTLYPELAKKYPSGRLPDLRGEFIRGWDNGRGVDNGRGLLAVQGDAIRNITGRLEFKAPGDVSGDTSLASSVTGVFQGVEQVVNKQSYGTKDQTGVNRWRYVDLDVSKQVPTASENRPRNIAFQYICLAA